MSREEFRQIRVDGCEIVGRGAHGIVYKIAPDEVVKVYREDVPLERIKAEKNRARRALILGVPTAISFDIVKVGDHYGAVYELLDAESTEKYINSSRDHLERFIEMSTELLKVIHAIDVSTDDLADMKADHLKWIGNVADLIGADTAEKIRDTVLEVPDSRKLLHGDFHMKNIIICRGEPMLIDMGEVSYGHPMTDLGHSYSAMVKLIGDYKQLIGLPQEMANDVWHRMIRYYFEGEPQDVIDHRIEQIDAVACVRGFSWLSLSDSFPESLIRECQEVFETRVTRRKDHLLRVCDTFSDWAL
jgi:uncharacterized protein (TIGR02172 family)